MGMKHLPLVTTMTPQFLSSAITSNGEVTLEQYGNNWPTEEDYMFLIILQSKCSPIIVNTAKKC